MKKQISVQNFSDEVAIISTSPGVAKSESSESSESGEPSDSMFPSIPLIPYQILARRAIILSAKRGPTKN